MNEQAQGGLSASNLAESLLELGCNQVYGVPDSTLEPVLAALAESGRIEHRVCANEAHALSHAAGFFLGSGRPALVYLQNSGLGNVVNPYTSLLAPQVMGVPALLLVGWRFPPGVADEPQHRLMGEITLPLLETMGIEHSLLTIDTDLQEAMRRAKAVLSERRCFALVVPKGTPFLLGTVRTGRAFAGGNRTEGAPKLPTRFEILTRLTERLPDAFFVSTTGKTSRELYLLREQGGIDPDRDLRIVGSMGCAASVAKGVSDARPGQRVCVLDGDGALLMHLGSLASIGMPEGRPFLHVVLDNGTHDSTGGQAIARPGAPFEAIARALGYVAASRATGVDALEQELASRTLWQGPRMIVVPIEKGSKPDLGRPGTSPFQNASAVARHFQVEE
jgi:phosphonopyruvate decarboxylase